MHFSPPPSFVLYSAAKRDPENPWQKKLAIPAGSIRSEVSDCADLFPGSLVCAARFTTRTPSSCRCSSADARDGDVFNTRILQIRENCHSDNFSDRLSSFEDTS